MKLLTLKYGILMAALFLLSLPAMAQDCTNVCSDLDGDGVAETCVPVCREGSRPVPNPQGPSVPDVGPSGPVTPSTSTPSVPIPDDDD